MSNLINAVACISASLLSVSSFSQDSCENKLLNYEHYRQADDAAYTLQLSSFSGGRLYYLGARHLTQPADPQFAAIKKAWEDVKPTIAFFEGPDRGIASSDTATIKNLGESGYTRFLAKAAGVKAVSMEPSPQALFQYLLTKQEQQKIELYFLLGEAMRLRTRLKYEREQIEKELVIMMGKIKGLTDKKMTINSIADLEEAYKKHWGNNSGWWTAPQAWFDPAKRSEETGGIFTNDINRLSSSFRNIHMFQLLAEYTNKGERVLAVIGRDHVVVQRAALRCAIR